MACVSGHGLGFAIKNFLTIQKNPSTPYDVVGVDWHQNASPRFALRLQIGNIGISWFARAWFGKYGILLMHFWCAFNWAFKTAIWKSRHTNEFQPEQERDGPDNLSALLHFEVESLWPLSESSAGEQSGSLHCPSPPSSRELQRLFSCGGQAYSREQGPQMLTLLLLIYLSLVSSLLCSFSVLPPVSSSRSCLHLASTFLLSISQCTSQSPRPVTTSLLSPHLYGNWFAFTFPSCSIGESFVLSLIVWITFLLDLDSMGLWEGEPFLLHHTCVASSSWEGGPLTPNCALLTSSWNHRTDLHVFIPVSCLSPSLFKHENQTLYTAHSSYCRGRATWPLLSEDSSKYNPVKLLVVFRHFFTKAQWCKLAASVVKHSPFSIPGNRGYRLGQTLVEMQR